MEFLKKILKEKRPGKWEELPDLDLYMDQVLSYMPRQHPGLELNENLTAAMVNNYIKKGLLPRAKGKKYTREHIAYLTAVCLLKQVVSVTDAGKILDSQVEEERREEQVHAFYERYAKLLDEEFSRVFEELEEGEKTSSLADLALKLAISSYAQKMACEQILNLLEEEKESEQEGKQTETGHC